MAKIIVIETCSQCPYFQDAYVPWGTTREFCKKQNLPVPWVRGGKDGRGSYPIPDFCSLSNFKENEHKDL